MTPRARSLVSLILSVMIVWTGLDRVSLTIITLVEDFMDNRGGRGLFTLASLFPLALAVWSLVLARQATAAAGDDATRSMGQASTVLAVLAVVVAAVTTLAVAKVGTPTSSVFRFAG